MEVSKVTVDHYLKLIGDGNIEKGFRVLHQIASRLEEEREKNRLYAKTDMRAMHAISMSVKDMEIEVVNDNTERANNEALRVIANSIRFILGEYN